MPRTRIGVALLAGLGELELDRQLDVVGQRESAFRQRRVPVEAELRAVDDRLQRDADLDRSAERLGRVGYRAARLDGLRLILDRQLSVEHQLLAVATDRLRCEAQLRVALGVEEVGRAEVGLEALVLGDDRAGSTVPVSSAAPSSPTVSVASSSSKRPRKVATSMCLTAKLADECVGSSFQVPTGRRVAVSTAVADMRSPLRLN